MIGNLLHRLGLRRSGEAGEGVAGTVDIGEVAAPGQVVTAIGRAGGRGVSFTISPSFWEKWDRDHEAECAANGHRHGNGGLCGWCGKRLTESDRMR